MVENVSAARHNNLQARLELILGTGAGPNGYGQGTRYGTAPESYPVSNQVGANTNIITADAMNSLYADMIRCRIHQVGTTPTEIAELIANLNIIAEDTSFIVNDDGIVIVDAEGTKKGIIDYELLMSTIETDKYLIHTGTLENGISSTRNTVWNGQITHEFNVNFLDSNHRRHFFNSGGQIRFSANNSGAVTPKGSDWSALLSGMGNINFDYDKTLSTGDGSGSGIGNYDLTETYQLIYRKVGGGYISGVYNGNIYEIYARSETDSTIRFKVLFDDVVDAGFADENVDGRLESIVKHFRADTEYVRVAAPTYTNISTLA